MEKKFHPWGEPQKQPNLWKEEKAFSIGLLSGFGLVALILICTAAVGTLYVGSFQDDGSGRTIMPPYFLTNFDQRQNIQMGNSIKISPASNPSSDNNDTFTFVGGGSTSIGVVFQSDQANQGGFDYDWGNGIDITYGTPYNGGNELMFSGEDFGCVFFPWLPLINQFSGGPTFCPSTNGVFVRGLKTQLQTKGTNYTLNAAEDNTIIVNISALTMTLPTAVDPAIIDGQFSVGPGHIYTIKLIAPATSGTVATTSSQKIDGATTYSLTASNKFVTVQSDGANWWIVASN